MTRYAAPKEHRTGMRCLCAGQAPLFLCYIINNMAEQTANQTTDTVSDSTHFHPVPAQDLYTMQMKALRQKYQKEWRAYVSARARCINSKNPRYKTNKKNKVCFTFTSFAEFLQTVGRCPTRYKRKPYRLCRTSLKHNFSPEHTFWCRWRTDEVERKPTDPIPDFSKNNEKGAERENAHE